MELSNPPLASLRPERELFFGKFASQAIPNFGMRKEALSQPTTGAVKTPLVDPLCDMAELSKEPQF
ncbi:MAG: hypothetical protein DWH94_10005 [Planctomycetota bacterium]|nr:MAG: hypothetical protein DWH94_10005 [Planctomycetota bacterium]